MYSEVSARATVAWRPRKQQTLRGSLLPSPSLLAPSKSPTLKERCQLCIHNMVEWHWLKNKTKTNKKRRWPLCFPLSKLADSHRKTLTLHAEENTINEDMHSKHLNEQDLLTILFTHTKSFNHSLLHLSVSLHSWYSCRTKIYKFELGR